MNTIIGDLIKEFQKSEEYARYLLMNVLPIYYADEEITKKTGFISYVYETNTNTHIIYINTDFFMSDIHLNLDFSVLLNVTGYGLKYNNQDKKFNYTSYSDTFIEWNNLLIKDVDFDAQFCKYVFRSVNSHMKDCIYRFNSINLDSTHDFHIIKLSQKSAKKIYIDNLKSVYSLNEESRKKLKIFYDILLDNKYCINDSKIIIHVYSEVHFYDSVDYCKKMNNKYKLEKLNNFKFVIKMHSVVSPYIKEYLEDVKKKSINNILLVYKVDV